MGPFPNLETRSKCIWWMIMASHFWNGVILQNLFCSLGARAPWSGLQFFYGAEGGSGSDLNYIKGSLKKNHFDGLSPHWPKPPPPKCGLCFFSHHCFIILFQYLYIIFKTWKGDSARNPPPHCGLNPSKCFFLNFPKQIFWWVTLVPDVSMINFSFLSIWNREVTDIVASLHTPDTRFRWHIFSYQD